MCAFQELDVLKKEDQVLSSPDISIILVTWNSGAVLSRCLERLFQQTYKNFEIIIVDNGSLDNTLEDTLKRWSALMDIQVILLEENLGFSVGNNIGARAAKGEWLALLNTDAFPEPNWLEILRLSAYQRTEFTFFTSRQLQFNSPALLDGSGDAYHISGLAWRQDYNQLASDHGLQQKEVFSACAAAAMYRREDFLAVGGFDEDYFSYFEDVDLSFRLRLAGGRCLYVPQAVVYHIGSLSTGRTSDFAYYHGHRNLVWTFFKDMPTLLLWVYMPLHLVVNLYLSISFLLKGRSVVAKSKIDAFKKLPLILQKRRHVQRMRNVSTWSIYRVMSRGIFEPHRASRGRTKE